MYMTIITTSFQLPSAHSPALSNIYHATALSLLQYCIVSRRPTCAQVLQCFSYRWDCQAALGNAEVCAVAQLPHYCAVTIQFGKQFERENPVSTALFFSFNFIALLQQADSVFGDFYRASICEGGLGSCNSGPAVKCGSANVDTCRMRINYADFSLRIHG